MPLTPATPKKIDQVKTILVIDVNYLSLYRKILYIYNILVYIL